MHKAQDEILMMMATNELTMKEVAESVSLSYQQLYYCLHTAKDIPLETYDALKKFFDSHGYSLHSAGSSRESIHRKGLILGCLASERVARLNREIARVEDHEDMTRAEADRVVHELDECETIIIKEFQKIREMCG